MKQSPRLRAKTSRPNHPPLRTLLRPLNLLMLSCNASFHLPKLLSTALIILIFSKVKKSPLVIFLIGRCTGSGAWASSSPALKRSRRILTLLGGFLITPIGSPCEDRAHYLSSLMIGYPAAFNALIGCSPTRPITHILASLIPQTLEDPHHRHPLLMSHLSSVHPLQAPPH